MQESRSRETEAQKIERRRVNALRQNARRSEQRRLMFGGNRTNATRNSVSTIDSSSRMITSDSITATSSEAFRFRDYCVSASVRPSAQKSVCAQSINQI